MSRRETAVWWAGSAFFALLSTSCERRTEKSRSAVRTLKKYIDTIAFDIGIVPARLGDTDPSPGLRSVDLHVRIVPREPHGVWPNGKAISADSLISAGEARKLIGVLAEVGFFDRAGKYHSEYVSNAAEKAPPPAGSKRYVLIQRTDRHCKIKVSVQDGEHFHIYYVDVLPWGPPVTRRLQALRKVVDGDAALLLNQLLAQVAVHSADRGDAANETRQSQRVRSPASSERSQFIRAAQALLERHRLSWEGREPVVVLNGDEVTVTFPPPKGVLAGEFIIKMERDTKRILDVKIWR